MSYSFNFAAPSRQEAMDRAGEAFDRIVNAQPLHAKDRKQALAALDAMVKLVPEPKSGQVVNVTMSGSLTWRGAQEAADIIGAGVSVHAGVGPEERRV